MGIHLTDEILCGLSFIQRYRYLTIKQFAKISGLKDSSAGESLRRYEKVGYLDSFGNVPIQGYGKTPKIYCLKQKGYDELLEHSDYTKREIGKFKQTKTEIRWSPKMYHRLAIVDVLLSLEIGVRQKEQLQIVKTFAEFLKVEKGNKIRAETTDFIADQETSENKLVPDATFVLERAQDNARKLYFIEVDLKTEAVQTNFKEEAIVRKTVRHKLQKYDTYLRSGRFQKTYEQWGSFRRFTLLFITTSAKRVDNIRTAASDLSSELHTHYRFNVLDVVIGEFFNREWKSRDIQDNKAYPLVQ